MPHGGGRRRRMIGAMARHRVQVLHAGGKTLRRIASESNSHVARDRECVTGAFVTGKSGSMACAFAGNARKLEAMRATSALTQSTGPRRLPRFAQQVEEALRLIGPPLSMGGAVHDVDCGSVLLGPVPACCRILVHPAKSSGAASPANRRRRDASARSTHDRQAAQVLAAWVAIADKVDARGGP